MTGSPDRFVIVVGELHDFVENRVTEALSRQEHRDERVGVRPFPRPQSERDADASARFVREWRERLPTHDAVLSGGLMAVAFDEFDDPAGYITAWARRAAPHCDADVEALTKWARRPLSRHAVVRSYVRACYRRTGLGVGLYVAAARAIAPEAVLCADACEPCGTTSVAARRLWSGASFSSQVRVEGLAAWGGERGAPPTGRRSNPGAPAGRVVVTERAASVLGERLTDVVGAARAARAAYEARPGGCAGWCQIIAGTAVDALARVGVDAELIFGRVEKGQRRLGHYWFEVSGVWADASADQFNGRTNDYPAVWLAMPEEMPSHSVTRRTMTALQMMGIRARR